MFRQAFRASSKQFVRYNSSAPSSSGVAQSEIDALLAKVKELGLPQNKTAASFRAAGGAHKGKRGARASSGHSGKSASGSKSSGKAQAKSNQPGEAKAQGQGQSNAAAQNRPKRLQTNLDGFDEVASSFTATGSVSGGSKQQRVRVKAKDRRFVNRDATSTSAQGRPQGQRARGGAKKNNGNSRRSANSRAENITYVNPNLDLIAKQYIPEPVTISSLLETSPFTSQTPNSRILKAYMELKANGEADVTGVLNGKSHFAPESVLQKMKTPQLKLNAEVVINSLNRNSSLDYNTKMKLLGPLTGLAPVKQLTA